MATKKRAHFHFPAGPAKPAPPVNNVPAPARGTFKIENDDGELSVLFNSIDLIKPIMLNRAVSFEAAEVAPYLARVKKERPANAPLFRAALAELKRFGESSLRCVR